MTLRTKFTDIMGIDNPIVSAPMGGSAGGALAAAIANGGGLGLIGGGRSDFEWIRSQIECATSHSPKPWGIGFLSWALLSETLHHALEFGPSAVMLSFGDPRAFAPVVRASEAKLIVQVVNLDEARVAVDVGADVIVAQGTEAGGHGGTRSTLPFVPAVVDLVSPTPVLAAGGIADGRGLAAALSLGAAGALVGTTSAAASSTLLEVLGGRPATPGGHFETSFSTNGAAVRSTLRPIRRRGPHIVRRNRVAICGSCPSGPARALI
jgi:nitronate monooxygenase